MRHHNSKRKFGRKKSERNALIISLACNLIIKEKIKTTLAKARELRPFAEKLVTHAKVDNLSKRRLIISKLGNQERVAKKLFEKIAIKYVDRNGGYTRITKLGRRLSDSAEMAYIEFI